MKMLKEYRGSSLPSVVNSNLWNRCQKKIALVMALMAALLWCFILSGRIMHDISCSPQETVYQRSFVIPLYMSMGS